jgi:hypothetical protein
MHPFTTEGANAGESDTELAALAVVLDLLFKKWPDQFTAHDVVAVVNASKPGVDGQTLRKHLLPSGSNPWARSDHWFSPQFIGDYLRGNLDAPVRSGDRGLVLRSWGDERGTRRVYGVRVLSLPNDRCPKNSG